MHDILVINLCSLCHYRRNLREIAIKYQELVVVVVFFFFFFLSVNILIQEQFENRNKRNTCYRHGYKNDVQNFHIFILKLFYGISEDRPVSVRFTQVTPVFAYFILINTSVSFPQS